MLTLAPKEILVVTEEKKRYCKTGQNRNDLNKPGKVLGPHKNNVYGMIFNRIAFYI